MTRRHHHDKRSRRGLALVLKIGAAVLVVLLVCVIAWKNETVHSRVSAFGDNEKLQKAEYDKQRALAAKKYGSSTKEEAKVVDKESVKADPSQSSTVKKASESERSSSNSNYGTYTVQSGDYLSTIAAKYNTTVQELIELNDLESSRVAAGVTLKVPMQEQQTSTRSAATE